jgi:hypothetical protein
MDGYFAGGCGNRPPSALRQRGFCEPIHEYLEKIQL